MVYSEVLLFWEFLTCFIVLFISLFCYKKATKPHLSFFNKFVQIFLAFITVVSYLFVNLFLANNVFPFLNGVILLKNFSFLIATVFLYFSWKGVSYKYSLILFLIKKLIFFAMWMSNILCVVLTFELINLLVILLVLDFYILNKKKTDNFIYYLVVYNFFITVSLLYLIMFLYYNTGCANVFWIFENPYYINYSRTFLILVFLKINIIPIFNINVKIYRNVHPDAVLVYTCVSFMYFFLFIGYLLSSSTSIVFFLIISILSCIVSSLNAQNKYDYLLVSTQLTMINFIFYLVLIW